MAKSIGQAGLNLIKKFEGCYLEAYKCPAGVWTIGYGHTIGVKEGQTITQAKADTYLIEDCKLFAAFVDNEHFVPLTKQLNANQRDALISFAFNCGAANLKTLCSGRTLEEISDAILLYNKANGKVLNGLVKRRKAEQELFNTEEEVAEMMKTIKNGSKGKIVKVWQVIIGLGGSEIDGIFGPKTEKLTKQWQKAKGLVDDGIVGTKTWTKALNSL